MKYSIFNDYVLLTEQIDWHDFYNHVDLRIKKDTILEIANRLILLQESEPVIILDNLRMNYNKSLCESDIVAHLGTNGPIENLHSFAHHVLGIKNKQWFDDRPNRMHYDVDSDEALAALRAGAKQNLFYRKSI